MVKKEKLINQYRFGISVKQVELREDQLLFADQAILKNQQVAWAYLAMVASGESIFPGVVAPAGLLELLPGSATDYHALNTVRRDMPRYAAHVDRLIDELTPRLSQAGFVLLDGHHKGFAYAVSGKGIPLLVLEDFADLKPLQQMYFQEQQTIPDNLLAAQDMRQLGAASIIQMLTRVIPEIDAGKSPLTLTLEEGVLALKDRVRHRFGSQTDDPIIRLLEQYNGTSSPAAR
jgi:hypothetical protein